MKKTVTFLLLSLFVLTPVDLIFASEHSTTAVLEAQLRAVKAHLARLTQKPTHNTLSHDEMRSVIKDGTNWLLTAQEENGHFAYEYVPYEGKYLKDDNIVRQGGALFVLGEVYRRQVKKDTETENGIKKAVDFFDSISIEGKDGGETFRCVANSEESTCKLGATALVLTGILGYVEGKPAVKKEYKKLITEYTTYILASQNKEGGFRNEYRTSKGFGEKESPFSNGEALLALVRAYQIESKPELKTAIDSAFTYLKEKEYDNSLYLWIMAALKDMHTLWPTEEYITYTRDFTLWRMAQRKQPPTDRNVCAYAEGIASAYSVLASKPLFGELPRLYEEINTLNAFHKTLQLEADDTYRVIKKEDGALSIGQLTEPKRAMGGFLTAHSVVTERIDFTQHCVSTYAQTLVEIDGQSL